MTHYQKLDVWKIGMILVRDAYLAARQLPKEELFGLTSQIKRAAVSIPTNIAEGMGRQYKKDTLQFLYIARGSAFELETLLRLALSLEFISTALYEQLQGQIDSLMKLLNGLINYIQKAILK